MSSEPCRHERDYTTAQAMKSYIDAAKIAGDAAIERDKALAEVARLRAGEAPATDVRDEACWPTSPQFIREWNEMTSLSRLIAADKILRDMQYAHTARIRAALDTP